MKCPVCKTELASTDKSCRICGFSKLHVEFVSASDAENWKNRVVIPYREEWIQQQSRSSIEQDKTQSNNIDRAEGYQQNKPTQGTNIALNYVKRGNMALEEKDWDRAESFFEQALNHDAECAEAYLGKFLIKKECADLSELAEHRFRIDTENINFQRALKFADSSLLGRIHAALEQQKVNIARRIEAARETTEQQKKTQMRLQTVRNRIAPAQKLISARGHTTVCIKVDGTVFATGENTQGQCNVASWNNVIQISNSDSHTVGLREDGTLCATGRNTEDQCKVDINTIDSASRMITQFSGDWTDLVDVSVNIGRTVAVKKHGGCVYAGMPINNETSYMLNMMMGMKLGGDIQSISCGPFHLVALKKDGTVRAYGENDAGQCDFRWPDWMNIVAVEVCYDNTIGLKSDGTIVMTKKDDLFIAEASSWTEIVAISAGTHAIVGLKEDGTIVKAGLIDTVDTSAWTDIVAVSLGYQHIIGLRSDGTLLSAGNNPHGECDVSGIRLFESIDTYEAERVFAKEEAKRKADEERRVREAAIKQAEIEKQRREAERERLEKERLEKEQIAREQRLAQERAFLELQRREQNEALLRKQRQLQQELSSLKGWFAGKRRKEIEGALRQIQAKIENL